MTSSSINIRAKVNQLKAKSSNIGNMNKGRARGPNYSNLESELLKNPMIQNAMDYIFETYGTFKDSSPTVMKEQIEKSENLAVWFQQKTQDVITASNLNEPIMKLDKIAADGLEIIEKRSKEITWQFTEKNGAFIQALQNWTAELFKISDNVNHQVLESVHTILDNVEEKLEIFIIPPSKDSLSYALEPSFKNTVGRIIDFNYRFNLGMINYIVDKSRSISDPNEWIIFMQKMLNPTHIATRLTIIQEEIKSRNKNKLYMTNEKLTELDKGLISAGHFMIQLLEDFKTVPRRSMNFFTSSFTYSRDITNQVINVKSINELKRITLRETDVVLEQLKAIFPNSDLIKNTKLWIVQQKKFNMKQQ